MYIAEITPFSKSFKNQSLSYFSAQDIKIGSIVTIPLKNKKIKGLVISINKVEDLKSEIKSSKFALKKIISISKNNLFNDIFLKSAKETADFFATSTGSIIQSLAPNIIFEEISKIEISKIKDEAEKEKQNIKSQKYIIQSQDNDRYSEYKSIIRENFAKDKSVLFVTPTTEDSEYAYKELSRGIEQYTFVLNSKKTKNEIISIYNELINTEKPALVICTCGFIANPIKNIGMIIIERENSIAYRTLKRPYFDIRFFAERYAENIHASFILGDLMLRAETLLRYDNSDFFEYSNIKFRSISDALQKIIDIKNPFEAPKKDNYISTSLSKLITDNHEENAHMFIFNQRKGLAPLIVCGDCGHIVKCNECFAPVVLYGKEATAQDNYFKCHSCQSTRYAGELCKNCSSWRLVSIGSGTEKIQKEIEQISPKTKVFILDKDHANNNKKATKIINEFYESPGSVLIGTEMALLYLHDPVENVAIASIDSMFSLPDFRIKERVLNILLRARSKAKQNFFIQTRNSEEKIFQNVKEGNLSDFYRKEFIDRKKFNYPPFSLIIKLSVHTKSQDKNCKEIEVIKETFKEEEILIYPKMIQRVKGYKSYNGIIKVERNEWPNLKIVEKLRSLPNYIQIEVDAENIL